MQEIKRINAPTHACIALLQATRLQEHDEEADGNFWGETAVNTESTAYQVKKGKMIVVVGKKSNEVDLWQ